MLTRIYCLVVLNIFLLNQLDTCHTCLMGLKVSIDKNLKEREGGGGEVVGEFQITLLPSNKGFVGIHFKIVAYVL